MDAEELQSWALSVISRRLPERSPLVSQDLLKERYWKAPDRPTSLKGAALLFCHPVLAEMFPSVPVMKIGKSSRSARRGRQSRFPSSKSGPERRVLRLFSTLEFDNALDHELDDRCSQFVEQAAVIKYATDGKFRRHKPDAFVCLEGRFEFQEVKYEKDASALEERWETIAAAINSLGFDYRVRTEKEIRRKPRYDNVWRVYEDRFSPLPQIEILVSLAEHLKAVGALRLIDIQSRFQISRDQVHALVRLGCLTFNFDLVCTPDTRVTLGRFAVQDIALSEQA